MRNSWLNRKGKAIKIAGILLISGMVTGMLSIAPAVFLIVGAVILILILTLSQEFVDAAPQDISYFHVLGILLRTGRDLVNHVFMILALSIGGLLYLKH
jgi:Zn-dependent membrane protease YugP